MGIGDVMSVVWGILGVFLTLWAGVVAAALLFPGSAEKARRALEDPKRTLFTGFGVLATLGLLSVALSANPAGPIKGLGLLLMGWLLALSVLGTSGVSLVVSRRIQDLQPGLAAYPALVRGAAFLVGGVLMPILGWFAFGPVLFIASLGAGWRAVVNLSLRRDLREVA
jgi:hypothetical protein